MAESVFEVGVCYKDKNGPIVDRYTKRWNCPIVPSEGMTVRVAKGFAGRVGSVVLDGRLDAVVVMLQPVEGRRRADDKVEMEAAGWWADEDG